MSPDFKKPDPAGKKPAKQAGTAPPGSQNPSDADLAPRNIVISRSVKHIPAKAYRNQKNIRSVRFPEHLVSIGEAAFSGCSAIEELQLPDDLKALGACVFRQCDSLKKVYLPPALEKLPQKAFLADAQLKAVRFSDKSRLSEIGNSAFSDCANLSFINLPPTLKVIGNRAFFRCRKLKALQFPEGLESIGREAFYFCSFESLKLPDSLVRLHDSAFFACKSLTEVRLPQNIRYIGKWAFHGCSRLKYLEIRHDPEYIGPWIINRAATVRCYKDSVMDRYCQESGFTVEYL